MATKETVLAQLEQKLLRALSSDRTLPIQIDITNLCNLRCSHCYHPHHKNKGALTLQQWLSILNEYDALTKRLAFHPHLIVCGGEPLLSDLFLPILQHAARFDRKYRLSILTNGTLAKNLDLSLVAEFDSPIFQVSIDGADEKSHDAIRGFGSFASALDGIRRFQSLGYGVELLAVLSKKSSATIQEFFDLAASLGVSAMGFARFIVEGQAKQLTLSGTDRVLTPLELKSAYTEILVQSARTKVKTGTRSPLMHLLHPKLGASPRFAEAIVVSYQGKMLASSRSRLELGDVLTEGLESLYLNHPIKRALRQGKIAQCGDCGFYRFCGGDRNAAFAATGNFLGHDPGCWLKAEDSTLFGKVGT
jgi:MoaA/NifB/PqqE/SkfB family radical SAM enzyme